MIPFYIATSLSRVREHNCLRDLLHKHGHRVTYDWTLHGSVQTSTVERLAELAHNESEGVLSADVVFILLPGGFGTHTELGLALGSGKKIILHSEDKGTFEANKKTCAFYHHRNISKLVCNFDATDAFLKAILI